MSTSKWIKYEGKGNPAPGTTFEIRFEDGVTAITKGLVCVDPRWWDNEWRKGKGFKQITHVRIATNIDFNIEECLVVTEEDKWVASAPTPAQRAQRQRTVAAYERYKHAHPDPIPYRPIGQVGIEKAFDKAVQDMEDKKK